MNLFGIYLGIKEMKLLVQRKMRFQYLLLLFIFCVCGRFFPLRISFRKLITSCIWHRCLILYKASDLLIVDSGNSVIIGKKAKFAH